jgi:hypothetical protein
MAGARAADAHGSGCAWRGRVQATGLVTPEGGAGRVRWPRTPPHRPGSNRFTGAFVRPGRRLVAEGFPGRPPHIAYKPYDAGSSVLVPARGSCDGGATIPAMTPPVRGGECAAEARRRERRQGGSAYPLRGRVPFPMLTMASATSPPRRANGATSTAICNKVSMNHAPARPACRCTAAAATHGGGERRCPPANPYHSDAALARPVPRLLWIACAAAPNHRARRSH